MGINVDFLEEKRLEFWVIIPIFVQAIFVSQISLYNTSSVVVVDVTIILIFLSKVVTLTA